MSSLPAGGMGITMAAETTGNLQHWLARPMSKLKPQRNFDDEAMCHARSFAGDFLEIQAETTMLAANSLTFTVGL